LTGEEVREKKKKSAAIMGLDMGSTSRVET
jgi:hypothetical protein